MILSLPPRAACCAARTHRGSASDASLTAVELLRQLPCPVILSGYPSALYEEWLRGWRSVELQVMNQAGVRTEKVWFKLTLDRVHWASYAGSNHTDRQRIKRKAQSWGRRYRELPPGERQAVLAALMAVEARE